MSFKPDGSFTRDTVPSWEDDATTGILIVANRHDDLDNEFAAGLSQCITTLGVSKPTAPISWNGQLLVNLGVRTPTPLPTDAVNYGQLLNWKTFSSSIAIAGADANGRLNFTSATGGNGISWTNADMSLLGRAATTAQKRQRLVVNSTIAGTGGTDLVSIDSGGFIETPGYFLRNLSFDGAEWRTPSAATGMQMLMAIGPDAVNGATLSLKTTDIATGANHDTVTLRTFQRVLSSEGNVSLGLFKQQSGDAVEITGWIGSLDAATHRARWRMLLGDSTAESTADAGSDFQLLAFADAGTPSRQVMHISRKTSALTLGGDLMLAAGKGYTSADDDVIVAGGDPTTGRVLLRPRGAASTTGEVIVESTGDLLMAGDNIEVKAALLKISTGVAGDIYLRPNGEASTVGQWRLAANGDVTMSGAFVGNIDLTGNSIEGDTALLKLSTKVAGDIYLRPNGETNQSGEWRLAATGNVTMTGSIAMKAGTSDLILAGNGETTGRVILSPQGAADVDGRAILNQAGIFELHATTGALKAGLGMTSRGPGATPGAGVYDPAYNCYFHFVPGGGGGTHVIVNGLDQGLINFTSDYRLKANVQPLDSTWNHVKALNPVRFTPAAFGLQEASDTEYWGLIAHELQVALLPTAADGYKDIPNLLQSPNQGTVLAALTRALQEAMARIEALEGAAA